MGLLRSEDMKHMMLVLPPRDAKAYVEAIGLDPDKSACHVQFEDMNENVHARPFRKYIQRLDEMERIIRYLTNDVIAKDEEKAKEVQKTNIDQYFENAKNLSLDKIERSLSELYQQFVKFQDNNERLMLEKVLSEEEYEVVKFAGELFKEKGGGASGITVPLLSDTQVLSTIAGVVDEKEFPKLDRALWRASRGKAFTIRRDCSQEFEDPKTGGKVRKTKFVAYFQGAGESGVSGALVTKVSRVCQAWGANLYDWPKNFEDAKERTLRIDTAKQDKTKALDTFKQFHRAEMQLLVDPVEGAVPCSNSTIEDWRLFCRQEKATYAIMNLFDVGMTMRCKIWFPAVDEGAFNDLLSGVDSKVRAILLPAAADAGISPPTYIQVNDLTAPWQEVVDTYGIPNYKTANPAVITTVTFPFVFGMMYGDIGHGSLLLLAGLFCVMNGEKLKYKLPIVNYARYLICQMGFFAVFAGFMYNDLFGIVSLPLFESRFEIEPCHGAHQCMGNVEGTRLPLANFDRFNEGPNHGNGPYPFGLDPAWHGTNNELLFVNNMKMKLSVLIGVLQMLLGVALRFSNAVYDKNGVDLFFECIPMLIFMVCFFGYMDFMILYKWTHVIGGKQGDASTTEKFAFEGSNGPPGLINSLICMAMHQEDAQPLWENAASTATYLMLFTVVSVPWILGPKPFILKMKHDRAVKAKEEKAQLGIEDEADEEEVGGHGHGGEFEFGEILIHQIIETIEYVLGTVSHTASYLRIWALSLAHQQLSVVFYSKTIQNGLALQVSPMIMGGVLFLLFGAWFAVTVGVLLMMDVLECFLHTLRLHWVEFQSKFYKNDGYKFAPFSIKTMLLDD